MKARYRGSTEKYGSFQFTHGNIYDIEQLSCRLIEHNYQIKDASDLIWIKVTEDGNQCIVPYSLSGLLAIWQII